ncbi:MAG: hypothetical protein CYPHOPRED_000343 [Cyphobasidiales sp. Tagirdzhanova-0007]|nr:MAG: hypothetical protein CYPHOPRED_000343 [Cyphobasidiales sp. Tagirdzhanova-0007]
MSSLDKRSSTSSHLLLSFLPSSLTLWISRAAPPLKKGSSHSYDEASSFSEQPERTIRIPDDASSRGTRPVLRHLDLSESRTLQWMVEVT